MSEEKNRIVPAVKGGRCFNGFHKDAGKVVHAVPAMPKNANGYWGDKSLCGTQPQGRSYEYRIIL